MEWLRSVDLAEFAPNLRGSGVHGGLIVSAEHIEMFFFYTCLPVGNQVSTLCSATDPGTPLQLWNFGPAVKYSSPEDSVTPSPCHSLFYPGGRAGGAGEERVCKCHVPRTPHNHRQSKGRHPAWVFSFCLHWYFNIFCASSPKSWASLSSATLGRGNRTILWTTSAQWTLELWCWTVALLRSPQLSEASAPT